MFSGKVCLLIYGFISTTSVMDYRIICKRSFPSTFRAYDRANHTMDSRPLIRLVSPLSLPVVPKDGHAPSVQRKETTGPHDDK